MRVIAPIPKQFEDSNGVPYANGKVTVYLHNSTSLAQIYKEAEGGTLAPNPTILDSHGAWNAFVNGGTAYDYVVQDEHDNVIFSYSNVKAYGSGGGGGGGLPPVILIAEADIVEGDDSDATKTFQFIEKSRVGDDVIVDENRDIRLNKGVYHVSLVVNINVNPTEESRPWIEEVTLNLPSGYGFVATLLDRSIRPPHSSSSPLVASFDYVVDTDNTKLKIHLAGLGDNCYANLKPICIHKMAEEA